MSKNQTPTAQNTVLSKKSDIPKHSRARSNAANMAAWGGGGMGGGMGGRHGWRHGRLRNGRLGWGLGMGGMGAGGMGGMGRPSSRRHGRPRREMRHGFAQHRPGSSRRAVPRWVAVAASAAAASARRTSASNHDNAGPLFVGDRHPPLANHTNSNGSYDHEHDQPAWFRHPHDAHPAGRNGARRRAPGCRPRRCLGQRTRPRVTTNQQFLEDIALKDTLKINDALSVFKMVLESLPDSVTVYPTENYYYFKFNYGGTQFSGNIRLENERRDKGQVHFAFAPEYSEWKTKISPRCSKF